MNSKLTTKKLAALLGEVDEIWTKYRHQHITLVNKKVREEVSKFARDNAAAKLSKKQAMSNEETLKAVRALPQFQEMLAKYWVHVSMSERCYKEIKDRKLIEVGGVEQDLATGVDKDSHEVSASKLLTDLGHILSNPDIAMEEKLRVLLLYFTMMDGVKDDERRRMMEAAQLSLDNSACVTNYLKMGIDETEKAGTKSVTKHTHKLCRDKERMKLFQRRAKISEFALSRYIPKIKQIMESAAQGSLHGGKFPYVTEPDRAPRATEATKTTALRATNLNWDWGSSTKTKKPQDDATSVSSGKPKIIVFVLGGITLPEMRCAYEVSHASDCEVYLGGDAIHTPPSFLKLLKNVPA